jgi:hypothetical protein
MIFTRAPARGTLPLYWHESFWFSGISKWLRASIAFSIKHARV